MQEFFGSARISEKIGSCLRKSRAGLGFGLKPSSPPQAPALTVAEDDGLPIRWRKGELIGCGAFGQVYMGMNLDSGELLAIKQVLIGANNARERAQAHIRELEEEVKLLKKLSHPNIVRYLGTAREEETLNILLEFVPGGSISSLLGKFGSFPESVIRTYTKQLLQGLEYLHLNGIIHRDIKGANILVDNKGCIKLADFGASKQVVKLATMTAAKSMKGTPYWMAPEVILQTGHGFSADIWSVGCTVIEMATGKPPWSQQFQEVAALFHIGTTRSHPPIPEHLSLEAKDFLLKCLHKEPNLRPSASDLLKHPFVTGECQDPHPVQSSSIMESCPTTAPTKSYTKKSFNLMTSVGGLKDEDQLNGSISMFYSGKLSMETPIWDMRDDLCQLDAKDDFLVDGSSFNPMSEPVDDWPCKFQESPDQVKIDCKELGGSTNDATENADLRDSDFTFPCGAVYEVTETKIRAFLDEKALDLEKMQTPLYEEFYNSLNASAPVEINCQVNVSNLKIPPKSAASPSRTMSETSVAHTDSVCNLSPGSSTRRGTSGGAGMSQIMREIPFGDDREEPNSLSSSFSDMKQKWEEELAQELEKKRAVMRQAGVGLKTSPNRKRERLRFTCPSK